jgi:hypothetical protein
VEEFGDDDGRDGVASTASSALDHFRKHSLKFAFRVVAMVMVGFDVMNSSVVPVCFVFVPHDLVLALSKSEEFLTLWGIRLRRTQGSCRPFAMSFSSAKNRNRTSVILDFASLAATFRKAASCNTIPHSVSALRDGA